MRILEHIARALCKDTGTDPDTPVGCGVSPSNPQQPCWTEFEWEASVALKAILTATDLTEKQFESLAEKTHVVVPKEPDDARLEAGNEAIQDGREWGKQVSAWKVGEAMLPEQEMT